VPRRGFIDALRPGDLLVANDAATLPASLHGTHTRTGSAIEVRLAGRRSLAADDVADFSAVAFGSGDFHLRTEDRSLPPELAADIVWRAAQDVNIYANWGEGFETPTFIELAYRNVGTGLNFDLKPAISRSTEIGVKAYVLETQRVNLAAFSINTTNEIVIDSATGGRTTYKNAGKTRRRGVEAQWEGALGGGFTGYAAYTYLSAVFAEDTTTGTPPPVGGPHRPDGRALADATAGLLGPSRLERAVRPGLRHVGLVFGERVREAGGAVLLTDHEEHPGGLPGVAVRDRHRHRLRQERSRQCASDV
jgi:outer membrane receptor protein involved in Fe transport